jgi:hypothetical protein
MYRRTMLVILGAALVALGGPGSWAADEKDSHKEHMKGPVGKCAVACAKCMLSCDMCTRHCGKMVAEGKKEHVKTMHLCQDCSDMCCAAAKIAARHGPTSTVTCEACAKVCDKCADACEKADDDMHMKECAKMCRECAKACRDMIKHIGHDKDKAES